MSLGELCAKSSGGSAADSYATVSRKRSRPATKSPLSSPRNHVSRVRHDDALGGWDQPLHVREPTSVTTSDCAPRTSSVGTRTLRRGGAEPLRVSLPSRLIADPDEGRVPVPVPTAVALAAHVLPESGQVARAGSMRVVGGDRVGDLVERREPVAVGGEEVTNARGPAGSSSTTTSTSTRPRASPGFSAAATRLVMPPSDAPTRTSGRWLRPRRPRAGRRRRHRACSSGPASQSLSP